ncbi:MAG: hypothetical protein ACRYFX_10455 [Janthinobacterium lividum]
MNVFQHLARAIIKQSFQVSVWTIEQFYDIALYEQKARELQELPAGTLGKDIADCLEKNGLRLVPGYESHDLKHVLLDFKMTPVDEIRLQAFMLGNGNYSPVSLVIFIFGALFLPDLWGTFYQDFTNGRRAAPLSTWTIEDYARCRTTTLREAVANYSPAPPYIFEMRAVVKLGAFAAILAGVAGMVFCLPFLFSAVLVDVVGAGFPFVAGAILASAGLLALTNLAKSGGAVTNSAAA